MRKRRQVVARGFEDHAACTVQYQADVLPSYQYSLRRSSWCFRLHDHQLCSGRDLCLSHVLCLFRLLVHPGWVLDTLACGFPSSRRAFAFAEASPCGLRRRYCAQWLPMFPFGSANLCGVEAMDESASLHSSRLRGVIRHDICDR